jgi:hypothetical protein
MRRRPRAIIGFGGSEVTMAEKTTRRSFIEDKIPEDVRRHVRAAREELREGLMVFLPPEFVEHRRRARKEMLLAWRSMIDAALQRIEDRGKEA